MRRALIAITLSSSLAGLAGCSGDTGSTGAAPGSATSTSVEPSPSIADYTADTNKICAELKKARDTGIKEFGAGIGQMVAHRQDGNTAEAKKAKQSTQKKADALAELVRAKTGAAQDPEFQQAGAEAADNIAASAKDETFFAQIKTVKDLGKLGSEVAGWVVPTATYCDSPAPAPTTSSPSAGPSR